MVRIYGHPFASFYWKTLIALYERQVPFEFLMVDGEHPANAEAIGRLAPTGQFPVLVDGDRVVIESAAIIEYLDLHHGDAPPLVPADRRAAIEARQMDSVFDDYVMAPLGRMVFNALRPQDKRDPQIVVEARTTLDKSYAWLNRWMANRKWAANDTFSIADCAAAPALFYANKVAPFRDSHRHVARYLDRLMERPSFARVLEEAAPYFKMFPEQNIAT